MKVKCLNGFFILDEDFPGEAAKFILRFGLDLVPFREKLTFDGLYNPPEHCISGQTYLEAAVTKSFAGDPWEIFDANSLVFSLALGLVVPKASILGAFEISQSGNYFISNGLIQPGSISTDAKKVISYDGQFSFDTLRFRYSAVYYD